ncbi:hypothetical protein DID73_00480 [Candidatus Marinamargulisbacteria bacterium SCGC AG-343-K17]|nr:hypothetical protein DID73_00480 [Candidatus Marinamargulisbacteria bacterium SCGC AG-343-K17]
MDANLNPVRKPSTSAQTQKAEQATGKGAAKKTTSAHKSQVKACLSKLSQMRFPTNISFRIPQTLKETGAAVLKRGQNMLDRAFSKSTKAEINQTAEQAKKLLVNLQKGMRQKVDQGAQSMSEKMGQGAKSMRQFASQVNVNARAFASEAKAAGAEMLGKATTAGSGMLDKAKQRVAGALPETMKDQMMAMKEEFQHLKNMSPEDRQAMLNNMLDAHDDFVGKVDQWMDGLANSAQDWMTTLKSDVITWVDSQRAPAQVSDATLKELSSVADSIKGVGNKIDLKGVMVGNRHMISPDDSTGGLIGTDMGQEVVNDVVDVIEGGVEVVGDALDLAEGVLDAAKNVAETGHAVANGAQGGVEILKCLLGA